MKYPELWWFARPAIWFLMRWRDVILLSNRLRDGMIVGLPIVCHLIICSFVVYRILQRDKVRPAEDCFEIKEFILKLVLLIVRLYQSRLAERKHFVTAFVTPRMKSAPSSSRAFQKKIWRPPLIFIFCCVFHICNQQKWVKGKHLIKIQIVIFATFLSVSLIVHIDAIS